MRGEVMKKIDPIELGGTLFIPAIHKDLVSVVSGGKYENLRSVVIDTEGAISDVEVDLAIEFITEMLQNFKKSSVLVFLRPRDTKVLELFLGLHNIENIDGFILPKFSLQNADTYLKILKNTRHQIMPSIEGKELFEQSKLLELREKVLPYQDKIILVRFGLEDMLRQLKMRRNCDESVFDFSVTHTILGNFIAIFKGAGFEISAGVYPCFKESEGFAKDVQRDLKEGLISKTIIHPNQIEIINELYKVKKEEFDEAIEICNSSKAIFSQNSKMAEKTTMIPYAQYIIKRAEVYGLKVT